MTEVIVRPHLGKAVLRRQGVFTIPGELAALECRCPQARGPCGGIDINRIPLQYRQFQLVVRHWGDRFIDLQRVRGFDWAGGFLELHGPWPSFNLANSMLDGGSPYVRSWGQREEDGLEHPEKALLALVKATLNRMDYILVGDFWFQDRMTDLEAPDDTGNP